MMDVIFHKEIEQGWLQVYMDNIIIAITDNNLYRVKSPTFFYQATEA